MPGMGRLPLCEAVNKSTHNESCAIDRAKDGLNRLSKCSRTSQPRGFISPKHLFLLQANDIISVFRLILLPYETSLTYHHVRQHLLLHAWGLNLQKRRRCPLWSDQLHEPQRPLLFERPLLHEQFHLLQPRHQRRALLQRRLY